MVNFLKALFIWERVIERELIGSGEGRGRVILPTEQGAQSQDSDHDLIWSRCLNNWAT